MTTATVQAFSMALGPALVSGGAKLNSRPLDASGDLGDMPSFREPGTGVGLSKVPCTVPQEPPETERPQVLGRELEKGNEAIQRLDTGTRGVQVARSSPETSGPGSLEREGCHRSDLPNGSGSCAPAPASAVVAAVAAVSARAAPPVQEASVMPRRCTAADPFWTAKAPGSGGTKETTSGSKSLAGVPLRCLSDVVEAVDRDGELEVPEAELSTVHIETWEQRLDWRSFLSEAVASSRARQLFNAFDVEAEPPSYARPPPSSAPAAGSTTAGKAPDVQPCVAPSGAGFSPTGRNSVAAPMLPTAPLPAASLPSAGEFSDGPASSLGREYGPL